MIVKLFAFLILLVSCTTANTQRVMLQKYFEKFNKEETSSSYLTMSKARYEEIYHSVSSSKYHLEPRHTMQTAELNSLDLIWPTSGILTSSFGVRTLKHRTQMHSGIDIGTQVGTPVYAAETGRIVFTGTKKGYGKAIIMRHDKSHETLYGHLSRIIVKSDQIVHRNQLIGYVGKTGRVTGANLHFEMRVNGVAKDPLNFLPGSFSGNHRVYVGEIIPMHREHQIVSIAPKKDQKS